MIQFNVASYVYVQITDEGWKHLYSTLAEPDDYIKHCIEPYRTIIEGEVWYKLQLFSVMELLGHNMYVTPKIKPIILLET